jgi:ABC-type transport system substrate-binding protein
MVPEGESVWVDGVNIVEVPDKTTLLAGLKTGKIDYATSGSAEQYLDLKADPNGNENISSRYSDSIIESH